MKKMLIEIDDEQYRWWALAITTIGGFMSILDTSIVNVALPKMMAAFAVGYDDAEWILTGYMLTMGCIQPATGYLCDVFGTKKMYILSLVIFIMGSALCGMAWDNDSMIVFRVLQALGGGMIIPVTMSLIYLIFPVHERNTALGVWGISAMVAPATGPTLSGYLTEYWNWRLIFDINVPIGIFGLILAVLFLRETDIKPECKFDVWGFISSTVGLFCLLLALSKGQKEGWTSIYILSLFYIALLSLTVFVYVELRNEDPLIDLTVFKEWNFTFSMSLIFISTAVLFGGVFLLPLFMENILGYTTIDTGLVLFPPAIVSGLMMPVAGKLADRFGAKPLAIVGMLFLLGGTLPFIWLDADTSKNFIIGIAVIRGIGLGLFVMPITVLSLAAVPLDKISRASSLNNAIRQVSGSFGIAILAAALDAQNKLHTARFAERLTDASYAAKQSLLALQKLFLHQGNTVYEAQHKALAVLSGMSQKQAAIFSFDDAFYVLAVFVLIGIGLAFFLRSTHSKNDGSSIVMIE